MAAMLCDVVRRRRRRRRWAHAPVIHAASHFDQKKRVAWVPISMHTCGSFFYNYGAPLGGPSGRRSSAIIFLSIQDKHTFSPITPKVSASYLVGSRRMVRLFVVAASVKQFPSSLESVTTIPVCLTRSMLRLGVLKTLG